MDLNAKDNFVADTDEDRDFQDTQDFPNTQINDVLEDYPEVDPLSQSRKYIVLGFAAVVLAGSFVTSSYFHDVQIGLNKTKGQLVKALAPIYSDDRADNHLVQVTAPGSKELNSDRSTVDKLYLEVKQRRKIPRAERDMIVNQSQGASSLTLNNQPELQLPSGYTPQWEKISLDTVGGSAIQVQLLKKPFTLDQTTQKSGLEYFYYSAYVYQQMSKQVKERKLSGQLKTLSALSQQLGGLVEQSTYQRFDGVPDGKLTHLQVRSQLLESLEQLNQKPLEVIDKTQTGKTLFQSGQKSKGAAGAALKQYQQLLAAIQNNPESKNYPQAMALVQELGNTTVQVALHLKLRWETVYACPGGHCQDQPSTMRLYTYQTLPASLAVLPTAEQVEIQ